MNKKLQGIPRGILERLYWEEKLTLKQIGEKFSCSTQTVLNYFRSIGIERRKYTDLFKGRKITWGQKIGDAQRGKKLSEEQKRKISQTRIERKISSPFKGLTKAQNPDLITCGCKAEKHWNWKGGISSKSIRLRQTSEYKVWRKRCFQRDKYTCQLCQKDRCYLNVHHIIPFSELLKENKNLFEIENGITLCKQCHKKIHQKPGTSL